MLNRVRFRLNDDDDGGKSDADSVARLKIITLIAFLNFHACRFLAAASFFFFAARNSIIIRQNPNIGRFVRQFCIAGANFVFVILLKIVIKSMKFCICACLIWYTRQGR